MFRLFETVSWALAAASVLAVALGCAISSNPSWADNPSSRLRIATIALRDAPNAQAMWAARTSKMMPVDVNASPSGAVFAPVIASVRQGGLAEGAVAMAAPKVSQTVRWHVEQRLPLSALLPRLRAPLRLRAERRRQAPFRALTSMKKCVIANAWFFFSGLIFVSAAQRSPRPGGPRGCPEGPCREGVSNRLAHFEAVYSHVVISGTITEEKHS